MNPSIGLALGSGGARGFAHLGVLKALTDKGIAINCIAGSSMGALIGALYASGQRLDSLYQLARTFKRKYFLDFTLPNMGFLQGDRIKEYIRLFTFNKNLEQFDIPIGVTATNLFDGSKKVFTGGSAADAVRASISIPGIFIPVNIDGQLFVDGGVVDRVPVSVAKQLGADFVIGVDCAHFSINTDVDSIYDVIIQSIDIMQDELVNATGPQADILLKPNVSAFSSRAFKDIEAIVDEGERETLRKMPEIIRSIEDWKEKKR
ncbi:patatin family protein [Sediminibacillus dalangtanensis]|uniref:Patatin family protein n=1 Tax=Sediminibacillus dalangtanensis TaxID=2729421 RepID=A0ABX7VS20_9BACI|nr:patatin-like phospholipase family protein [Sediminibacillus dalangtanensis]QTM99318.1 patatin family protein [Sediminibacillus dalangtanensis]